MKLSHRCTWICYIYLFEWNVICGRVGTELFYIKMEHAPAGMSPFLLAFRVTCLLGLPFIVCTIGVYWFMTVYQILHLSPLSYCSIFCLESLNHMALYLNLFIGIFFLGVFFFHLSMTLVQLEFNLKCMNGLGICLLTVMLCITR